ncbi:MAG TPA: hypothetical protein VFY49_16935, partial [Myxococcota bacterium]|nr:hypothetical protein [Myxococcota bacterium]
MRRLSMALLALLLLTTGCSILRAPMRWVGIGGAGGDVTLEGLRQELAFQAASFAGAVTTASDDITGATTNRRIRRYALIWRLRVIPLAQRAAFNDDPRAGYLQSLLLATLQRNYFETGDGKDLFGPQQPIAIETAQRLEQQAADIGQRFLKKQELAAVVAEVKRYAAQFPIQGREFSMQRAISGAAQLQQSDLFTQVLSIPLAPFRALEGVDSGAQAIREFNVTARRFNDILAQLPEQLRGELELLLYDVEDRETVMEGLAAFQSLAQSADRASVTVSELPEDLRTNLQAVIEGSNQSVVRIAAAVDQLRAISGPLDDTAKNLREASVAWREVIGSWDQRNSDPTPGRPFDIREWGQTASQIGTAAGELRGLATDVKQVEPS